VSALCRVTPSPPELSLDKAKSQLTFSRNVGIEDKKDGTFVLLGYQLDGTTLEQWRVGRLVGTVEQIREQAATWDGLGVETLILGVGAVPFHVGAADDVALLAEALRVTGDTAPAG
jgi:hypothetical protein